LPHCPYKAAPFARDGADQPLLVAVIAYWGTRGIEAVGERRFRHNAPALHGMENSVLADDALAVGNEEFQQVKHLGLDCNKLIPPPEFAACWVKDKVFKRIKHFRPRQSRSRIKHRLCANACGKNQAHRKEISRS